MKRTKIIITLGPAIENIHMMTSIIRAGADIARINTAHGNITYHQHLVERLKEASKKTKKFIGIMLDIKGPEIRTGEVENDEIELKEGKTLLLTSENIIGTSKRLSLNRSLSPFLDKGDIVLLDNGKIKLKVIKVKKDEIVTQIIQGGKIKGKRGVNVLGKDFPFPYLTRKDLNYLQFAVKNEIDFIAASFVRRANDIFEIKKALTEFKGNIPIIAKIETKSAIKHIEEILWISDGIMVARGDLGVEMPVEELPEVQKYLLKMAIAQAKPTIIATQILETMINQPIPTRAEVSDIANAILDGADALMLSGETAIGKYPIEAVKVLVKVAKKTETFFFKTSLFFELKGGISHNVSNAATLLAKEMEADAILCLTRSGKTARLISRHKPKTKILVATYNEKILRQISILWGAQGFLTKKLPTTDETITSAIQNALKKRLLKKGNTIIITSGEPSGPSGITNIIRVQVVGDILGKGVAFGKRRVRGKVCFGINERGEILVRKEMPEIFTLLSFKGVIIENEIFNPEIIKKAVKKGVTIIIGVKNILKHLKPGDVIQIDPKRGIVFR